MSAAKNRTEPILSAKEEQSQKPQELVSVDIVARQNISTKYGFFAKGEIKRISPEVADALRASHPNIF